MPLASALPATAAIALLAALAGPSWWKAERTSERSGSSYTETFVGVSEHPDGFGTVVPAIAVLLLTVAVLVTVRRATDRRRAAARGAGGVAIVAGLALPWWSIAGFGQSGFVILFGADLALAALGVAIALVPRIPASVAAVALAVALFCGLTEHLAVGVVVSALGAAAALLASRREARNNVLALGAAVLVVAACAVQEVPDLFDLADMPRDLPSPLVLAPAGVVVLAAGLALRRRAPTARV